MGLGSLPLTSSETMADLKEGTIFHGRATKYIEWRFGVKMDLKSLSYGERFFGDQTGDMHPLQQLSPQRYQIGQSKCYCMTISVR